LAAVIVLSMAVLALARSASAMDVEFRGNRALKSDVLFGAVRDAATRDSRGEVVRGVQDLYIAAGYLFSRIEVSDRDGVLVLDIDEGSPATFRDVSVRGASYFSEDDILAMVRARPGQAFRPEAFSGAIADLLKRYDTEGFPFAQIWMDSLQIDTAAQVVDVNIHIVEGGNKELRTVKVEGLTKTREDLAVRLSGLRVGRPYDGDHLQEAYLRLSSSGIFDDVSYPSITLAPESGGVDAVIQVIESQRSNSFSAALGYADREVESADAIISGVVQLDLLNIAGSLRDLSVFWRNDGAGRSETRLQFRQRFLFGRRMSLGIRLEQIGIDTLSTWQSLGLETSAPIGRIAGGLFGLDGAVFGDRNTFGVGGVAQTLRMRFQGGFSYTAGDERRGAFVDFRNRGTFARKTIDLRVADDSLSVASGDRESVLQYLVDAGLRTGTTLRRNVFLTHELRFQTLESDEALVPLSEQFYIGGAATLRGYRENQFHGRRVAYSRNELGLGRSRSENGYAFVDAGYIAQEQLLPDGTVGKSDLFRVGYGFGVRTQSPAGNIDISFGIGEELSLQQTKIHVILNRNF
jgi:hypothetical protein